MRVDIGNNIFYTSDFSDNTLPVAAQAYESIYSIVGRGQFIEASFKFDSEKISFRVAINGENNIDIDVKELKDFYDDDNRAHIAPSISYDASEKLLMIKFPMPIQYNDGIEFLAKTNDGNKTKKLKGYTIIVNKEDE